MTPVMYALLAIGAALVIFWGWLLYTTPPKVCDDGCECCADDAANPITQPESWP